MNIKKTFFLTGILILPLLLSACGANQEVPQNENNPDNSYSEENKQPQGGEEDGSLENNNNEDEKAAEAESGEVEDSSDEISSDDWISMERLREGFRVKHPSGWYYVSNFKEAQAKGLNAMIGFGKDSGVWNQDPPYMIEIVSYAKEDGLESDRYSAILGEKGGDEFALRSDDDLREYADLMAESFEFID